MSKRKLPITFIAGCAINKDMYYIGASVNPSGEMESVPHSVMLIYQAQTAEKWFYHELPGWDVVSTAFPEPDLDGLRRLYALASNGAVECYSRVGVSIERMGRPGVGPESSPYGPLTKIREIGDSLFACGLGGQVYRLSSNGWRAHDQGISVNVFASIAGDDTNGRGREKSVNEIINALDDDVLLYDINGSSSRDLYAVGAEGFVAHHDGDSWRRLPISTAAALNCVHVVSSDDIFIVGSAGTILRGNARSGFGVISRNPVDTDWLSITALAGVMYLSGDDGIYQLANDAAVRLNISDDFALRDVSEIEAKDGVLWALSPGKLVRFSQGHWEAFQHPNNWVAA